MEAAVLTFSGIPRLANFCTCREATRDNYVSKLNIRVELTYLVKQGKHSLITIPEHMCVWAKSCCSTHKQ